MAFEAGPAHLPSPHTFKFTRRERLAKPYLSFTLSPNLT